MYTYGSNILYDTYLLFWLCHVLRFNFCYILIYNFNEKDMAQHLIGDMHFEKINIDIEDTMRNLFKAIHMHKICIVQNVWLRSRF